MELGIADGEDFIYDEDFGFEVGGDGEGESDVHPGGVAFDGGVYKLFDTGEGYDFVEFAADFGAGHAEDGAVEVDVFATAQFGVEAGTDFEQTGYSAIDHYPAGSRFGNAAQDLQQSRFAGAIAADDPYAVARLDFEIEIL